jgi:hypothetical protein
MADLVARGIRVTARGETLRVDAPRGILTASDRAALVHHKSAVLAALREEVARVTTATDRTADGPDGPCGVCGHQPLAWLDGGPVLGEGRWWCLRCSERPAASLAEVHAGLTHAERLRLYAEGQDGDPLARLLLELVAAGSA